MRRLVIAAVLFFAGHIALAQTFVKYDTTTKGNWSGVYGSSSASIAVVPAIASAPVTFTNAATYTWSSSTTDVRALTTTSGIREATCWYNSSPWSFSISFTDGLQHQVALYVVDWDSQGRTETIQAGGAAPQVISGFTQGEYVIYDVTGTVVFTITSNAGPNSVVSGIFVDPMGTVTPPTPPATCPTPSVNLFWQAVAGATGYNVYQNGVKLTAMPITSPLSYTIGGLAAGTYSFQITSVNASGESPLSSSLPVTVP